MKKSEYFFKIAGADQHRLSEYILRNKIDAEPAQTLFSSKYLYWGELSLDEITSLRLAFDIKELVDIGTRGQSPLYNTRD